MNMNARPFSSRWIKVLTWAGVILWTLVCFGLFAILGTSGEVIANFINGTTVGDFFATATNLIAGLGQFLMVLFWLFGLVVLFGVGWVARQFVAVRARSSRTITIDDYHDVTPR